MDAIFTRSNPAPDSALQRLERDAEEDPDELSRSAESVRGRRGHGTAVSRGIWRLLPDGHSSEEQILPES